MSEVSSVPIRILVVDDHPLLREGMAAVLAAQPDLQLVGEAGDGLQALQAYRTLRPDLVLLDLQLPGLGGIEVIVALRKEFPQARIVVVTAARGDVQAVRALEAGASGYLLKSGLRRELVDTVRAVHQGRRQVQAEVAAGIAEHLLGDSLSAREIQVLQRVAAGNSNKAVAALLSIAEETVKAHMKNILCKLGARDRTHAVAIAVKRGIIEL
ncbi:response regulator transcription factor [Xanthomonas hyacinthi]|uniref:DNA-binding response regulator n=2 Tax=Xanthomonas hyacinthi TaxID=56455 RepID=A0A2S7F192_9XANT|nr:LuxR family transcriptional regulator [Xanthomonas hyacinthi DSM 19077]PPU99209.1 DNA-binding response regulator [Xanthomonas hyacinthi]QGY78189.1 response regulator transcription factor [Xanthomonas hyacinthi]